jgi:serine/threonine protein kinase
MLYGNVPFKGIDMKELHKQIMDADFTLKDEISTGNTFLLFIFNLEAQELIKGLLTRNPKQRMTISQVLKHPWLQKVEEKSNHKLLLIQIF